VDGIASDMDFPKPNPPITVEKLQSLIVPVGYTLGTSLSPSTPVYGLSYSGMEIYSADNSDFKAEET